MLNSLLDKYLKQGSFLFWVCCFLCFIAEPYSNMFNDFLKPDIPLFKLYILDALKISTNIFFGFVFAFLTNRKGFFSFIIVFLISYFTIELHSSLMNAFVHDGFAASMFRFSNRFLFFLTPLFQVLPYFFTGEHILKYSRKIGKQVLISLTLTMLLFAYVFIGDRLGWDMFGFYLSFGKYYIDLSGVHVYIDILLAVQSFRYISTHKITTS